MYASLETVRDALGAIDGVASCKIGLEPNISPASYPLIRVVPVRIVPGKPYHGRTCETLLYFGTPVATSAGLETVYEELFDLEAEILRVIKAADGRYIETVTDEDRLDTYKLMAIRCELREDLEDATRVRVSAIPAAAVADGAAAEVA